MTVPMLAMLALLAALPSSAVAANAFTLDTSFDGFASVAVDSTGTGFFAWEHKVPGGDDVTMECTVARGGTCTAPQTLPAPPVGASGSSAVEQPLVVLGGGSTVYVVGPRFIASDVVLWTSTDGGQTWGVGSVAQTGAYQGTDPTDALLDGSAFDISSHNPGLYFSSVPATGPGPANGADLTPAASPGVESSTLGLAAGKPLEAVSLRPAAGSQHDTVNFTSYSGTGDPNSAANWTVPARVSDGIAPSLASGPAGPFLASEDYAGAGGSASQVNVRKYDGSSFGAPVTLQGDTTGDGAGSIFETPSGGQVLAAWEGAARPDHNLPIRLYRSTDGGSTFAQLGDIAATTTPADSISAVRIAAADDGSGFVTFDEATSALRVADFTAASPPPGPPVARAAFVSLKAPPGRVILDASGSRPTGAIVKSYAWNLDGHAGPGPSALCGGDASQLTTRIAQAGTHSVVLDVTDSSGVKSTVTHTLFVPPGPGVRSARSAGAARGPVFAPVFVCSPGPTDHPGDVTAGGGPPSGCATEVQFGLADAVGCLNPITSRADYPAAEGEILGRLADQTCICGHLSSSGSKVSLGGLEATLSATQDPYVSTGPVRINGIDFYPNSGAAIVLVPNQDLVVSSDATMKLGGVTLQSGRVVFFVPQGIGRANKVHVDDYTLSDQAKRIGIGGLPFDGSIGLDFVYHRAQLPVHVTLPNIFAAGEGGPPIEGAVTLSTDNAHGLLLDAVDISVPQAFLGPLEVDHLFFHYQRDGDIWAGGADIVFPGGKLKATPPPPDNGFGLKGGSFDHAGATLSFTPPLEIFTGVDLDHISFSIGLNPTRFIGGAGIDVLDIAQVDGSLAMVFATPDSPYDFPPKAGPGLGPLAGRHLTSTSIAVGGAVSLDTPAGPFGPLADGYLLYKYPDYVEFAGREHLDLSVVTLDGQIDGFAQPSKKRFNVEGSLTACLNIKVFGKRVGCLGVYGVISSNGIAACGNFPIFFGIPVGLGYRWGDSTPDVMVFSCDIGPYRAVAAAAAGATGHSFTLRAGLPSATVRVRGTTGAPVLTLVGPHGERVSAAADGSGAVEHGLALLPVPQAKTTYIGIKNPSPGTWTVTTQPGSSQIASLQEANGLPAPQVHARVLGAGATRTLLYELRPLPGQDVSFVEQGPATWHLIGRPKGAHGRIRFTPATGPGGLRKIVALVSHGGITSKQIDLASYRAQPPARPGTPARVRVTRHRRSLVISWTAARHVLRYGVTVTLSDGRQLLYTTTAGKRTVHITNVALTLSGTVRVVGIGSLREHGHPAIRKFPRRQTPKPTRPPRLYA
ncbi:MAG: hypothetical protein ACYC91_02210 [Solirubrobacteraceae bacterium]